MLWRRSKPRRNAGRQHCESHHTVAAAGRVLALVAIDSLAQSERIDRWSRHDFWVVTTTAAQADFLTDLSSLPDHTVLAMTPRPAEQ